MSESVENVDSPRGGLACQNCRRRKRKCDRQVPRCGSCIRRGLDCVMQVIKSIDGQEGAVQSLEKEISNLEAQLSRLQTTTTALHPTPAVLQQQVDPTPVPFEASISSIASREQSMDTVDLDVLREVETVSLYRGELYSLQKMTRRALRLANCDPRGILDLTPKKSLLASYDASIYSKPNGTGDYLDYDIAVYYASKYFSYIHPTFPIVSEAVVQSVLNKVTVGSQSTNLGDRVMFHLIISIGAILPIESSAAFDTRNSADYFIRAMEIQYSYDESATTAQILLLLAIYSLFDPGTGSSWHLMDLVTQACIVMGYHQLQPESRGTAAADGDGAKLFQASYVLDFCVSSALGLPMSIQNRDISSDWETCIVKPPNICTSESEGLTLVEMFSWAYELCGSFQNDGAGYLSYYNEYLRRRILNHKGEISYLSKIFGLHLATQSINRSAGARSALEDRGKLVQDHLAVLQNSVSTWFALPWITGYSIFQLGLLQLLFCGGLPQKQRISQISQTLSLAEMILSVISTRFPGLYPHKALVNKVLTQMATSDVDSRHNIDFLDGSDLYEFCRNALMSVGMGISH